MTTVAQTLPTPAPAAPTVSLLPGVNVMLMGPAGTGKTHSIGTLVDSGVEVFAIFLESGQESLLGYWTDRGLPIPSNLYWHQIAAPKNTFKDMLASSTRVNTMALEPCENCKSALTKTQGTPCLANSSAVTMPAGPAPTMTTLCLLCGPCCEANQGLKTW